MIFGNIRSSSVARSFMLEITGAISPGLSIPACHPVPHLAVRSMACFDDPRPTMEEAAE